MAKIKRTIIFTIAIVILLALVIWIAWGNTALQLNIQAISHPDLPAAFDGYRIAHISDLHNTEIGRNYEKLLQILRDAEPDMIAITGDLIDSRRTDTEIALQFVREAVKIAPCYYVTGNHEARVTQYVDLKKSMIDAGVTVLEDTQTDIALNGQSITLIGVNDPSFETDYLLGDAEELMCTKLKTLHTEEGFTVLLSHRPELFDTYAENGIDLALSGHAHGGQFRLPFIGGLVAPNQGIFPKYDAGHYQKETTNMIVSRGIGNSLFPFRFNNRPEVILVELRAQ